MNRAKRPRKSWYSSKFIPSTLLRCLGLVAVTGPEKKTVSQRVILDDAPLDDGSLVMGVVAFYVLTSGRSWVVNILFCFYALLKFVVLEINSTRTGPPISLGGNIG